MKSVVEYRLAYNSDYTVNLCDHCADSDITPKIFGPLGGAVRGRRKGFCEGCDYHMSRVHRTGTRVRSRDLQDTGRVLERIDDSHVLVGWAAGDKVTVNIADLEALS